MEIISIWYAIRPTPKKKLQTVISFMAITTTQRNVDAHRFFRRRWRDRVFRSADGVTAVNILAVYGGSESSQMPLKNILICVSKMNEGLMGLERHED